MLENLKIKLIKIAKDAEKHNLCTEKTGSFSIRDERSGYVIITPSKIRIENLNEKHVCVVDLNGNIIENIEKIKQSNDLLMHLEVYKARKDVRSIIHINPNYTTIFSVINKGIPPITYDSANYGGYIYVTEYDNKKITESAKNIIEKLSISDACLLESNGAVIVSQDIENILYKAICVEKAAETYYKALTLSQFKEPKKITREELMSYIENQ